ncbi:MAG: LytTR family DNA-binding domain-containing protein [Sphingorhabdus sp.]
MTILAPLGTDTMSFWPRLAYWFILMESGALIGVGVVLAMQHWGKLFDQRWAEMALIAFIIAVPLSLIIIGTMTIFVGAQSLSIIDFLSLFGIAFAICWAMTALSYFTTQSQPSMVTATDARDNMGTGIFAERLPLPLRNKQLLALKAEDHYLRVFVEGGSELILLRLSDAITELGDDLGAQTHRSWWVTKSAIAKIRKTDGRATLTLSNGEEVPVSRSHYRKLKNDGWFI